MTAEVPADVVRAKRSLTGELRRHGWFIGIGAARDEHARWYIVVLVHNASDLPGVPAEHEGVPVVGKVGGAPTKHD